MSATPPNTVIVDAVDVADMLRRTFVGWLFSTDEVGPVAAVAVPNTHIHDSPHTALWRALEGCHAIARLDGSTAAGKFLMSLYNGGRGIFHGEEGGQLLLPVTAMCAHPTAGAAEVVVAGVVARSPEFLIVQQDVFNRIMLRIDSYGEYSVSQARHRSFLAFYAAGTRREVLRAKVGDPGAAEWLVNKHPGLTAPLLSALRAAAVWHSLFGDGGKQFRDPQARALALEALSRAVLAIIDANVA